MLDLDEYNLKYQKITLSEGWWLSEVDYPGHGAIEVQKIDDPQAVGRDNNIVVPELACDDDAVAMFQASYRQGRDHALEAYALLRRHSPQEFEFWNMGSWQIKTKE